MYKPKKPRLVCHDKEAPFPARRPKYNNTGPPSRRRSDLTAKHQDEQADTHSSKPSVGSTDYSESLQTDSSPAHSQVERPPHPLKTLNSLQHRISSLKHKPSDRADRTEQRLKAVFKQSGDGASSSRQSVASAGIQSLPVDTEKEHENDASGGQPRNASTCYQNGDFAPSSGSVNGSKNSILETSPQRIYDATGNVHIYASTGSQDADVESGNQHSDGATHATDSNDASTGAKNSDSARGSKTDVTPSVQHINAETGKQYSEDPPGSQQSHVATRQHYECVAPGSQDSQASKSSPATYLASVDHSGKVANDSQLNSQNNCSIDSRQWTEDMSKTTVNPSSDFKWGWDSEGHEARMNARVSALKLAPIRTKSYADMASNVYVPPDEPSSVIGKSRAHTVPTSAVSRSEDMQSEITKRGPGLGLSRLLRRVSGRGQQQPKVAKKPTLINAAQEVGKQNLSAKDSVGCGCF